MHYNARIIYYPNGEVQIRKYSNPLYMNPLSVDDLTEEEKKNKRLENDKKRNPFNNKICYDYISDDDFAERQFQNKMRSCNRTKQAVFTYARCCNWEYFITLTMSPDLVNRYDFQACSKKVRKWLNNQRINAPDLKYLLVPEQHEDGAWHFHGLLADIGSIKLVDSGKKDKGQVIYNFEKYKFGWTTATKVKNINKVAKYVGKYVTKALSDSLVGCNRYFVSTNLPKPKQTLYFLEDNEVDSFVEIVADSLGKKIAHVSQTQAIEVFTQCTYFELQ